MKRALILVASTAITLALISCSSGAKSQVSHESNISKSPDQAVEEVQADKSSGQDESRAIESTADAVSDGESSSGSSNEPEATANLDFVLPDSSKRVYSTSELEKLSDDDLFYARNELFARHGAQFEDEDLKKYFGPKRWYRAIEPKLDEYGSGILNLIEGVNAATLRRIELERGSKHVNPLDPKRAEMYEAYRVKAEEYQRRYGAAELVNRDAHDGLMGLCLVQLVDFEGDDWEELLLAYHDGGSAPKGDFFNPDSFRIEVWSYQDGALEQVEWMGAYSTQATSSYFLLCRAGEGYEFGSSKSQDGGLVYYYRLSQSNSPATGDQYWRNESDISFEFDQMLTITAETLATLGSKDNAAFQKTKLRDNGAQFLVGKLVLVEGDGKEYPGFRLWAALEPDEPVVYASKYHGDFELERIQLGPASTDQVGQPAWEPYEGQRIAVVGKLHEQQYSDESLTPCILDEASVLGVGEGNSNDRRDEVAVEFATAIYTNYRIVDGEYVGGRLDYHQYISPTSELYEWNDGNDEGTGILILGNPSRVESAEVVDAIGDVYIVDMIACWPKDSLENEVSQSLTLAVVFSGDNLVEHAYLW